MIELMSRNGEIVEIPEGEKNKVHENDFLVLQINNYTSDDIEWLVNDFGLDFTIMNHAEDIEVSSHFYESEDQFAIHFSLPFYAEKDKIEEEPVFLIMKSDRLFIFNSASFDKYFSEVYSIRFQRRKDNINSIDALFKTQIEFIADYYADMTEGMAKKIKGLAARVLLKKEFKDDDLDTITQFNFNNMLIKELLNEYVRILTLFKKSGWEKRLNAKEKIDAELNDLAVVSDYIQFNFDRLDDLKENVSNKIDLEQNHIFKTLTIVTVCIAFPTLIAGIYGMNFEVIPELKWAYGYPVALLIMFASILTPAMYFKRKRWF